MGTWAGLHRRWASWWPDSGVHWPDFRVLDQKNAVTFVGNMPYTQLCSWSRLTQAQYVYT